MLVLRMRQCSFMQCYDILVISVYLLNPNHAHLLMVQSRFIFTAFKEWWWTRNHSFQLIVWVLTTFPQHRAHSICWMHICKYCQPSTVLLCMSGLSANSECTVNCNNGAIYGVECWSVQFVTYALRWICSGQCSWVLHYRELVCSLLKETLMQQSELVEGFVTVLEFKKL